LELSLYSLSLSLTLRYLEFSRSTSTLDQERKRRKEEAKIKQGKAGSSSYNRLHCRYQLSCVFSFLALACIVLHVVLFYHGMGFLGVIVFFNLAFPFPDSFDEMGSLMRFVGDG